MEGLVVGRRTRNIRGHALRLGVLLLLLLAGMLILGARQSVYAADISGAVSSSALEANKAIRLTANTTLTIDADKIVTSIDLNGYRLTIQGNRTLTLTSGIKDGNGSTNTVGLTVNSGNLAVLKNTPLLLTDNSVAGNRRIAAYAVDVQAYQLTIFGGPGSVTEATAKAVLSLN